MARRSVDNPRVFVSYSHDSPEHTYRVLVLSDLLRHNGFDATMDQYVDAPVTGWYEWMIDQLNEADFVVVICTENYFHRFNENDYKRHKAHGTFINKEIYETYKDSVTFIPVLFSEEDSDFIPPPLKDSNPCVISDEQSYGNLFRRMASPEFIQALRSGQTRNIIPLKSRHNFFAPFWQVPFARNVFFVGREEPIQAIHKAFETTTLAVLTAEEESLRPTGIGKTEVALEFVYRCRDYYQAIFWARANTSDLFMLDVEHFANTIHLPQRSERNQLTILKAVKQWLANHAGWLIVMDDLSDLSLMAELLPENYRGHVLVTADHNELTFPEHARHVEIGELAPDEVSDFFKARCSDSLAQPGEKEAIDQLTALVGPSPLALKQAITFTQNHAMTVRAYVDQYTQFTGQWHDEDDPFDEAGLDSIAKTIEISLDQLESTNPAAADLLRMTAFLSPYAVLPELFIDGIEHLPESMQIKLGNAPNPSLILDVLISELVDLSLGRRERGTNGFTVHKLVQQILRNHLTPEWAGRVARLMDEVFPIPEEKNYSLCNRTLHHSIVAGENLDKNHDEADLAGHIFNKAALYLVKRGRWDRAAQLYQRAISIAELTQGDEHPRLGSRLNNLAMLYRQQGRSKDAEPLLHRAIALHEKSLGANHPFLASELCNLGLVFLDLGKTDHLGPLILRLTETQLERISTKDLNLLTSSIDALAEHCVRHKLTTEAVTLYRCVLALIEAKHGPESSKLSKRINQLAILETQKGKIGKAKGLLKRAIRIDEKALGEKHPRIATYLNNLGRIYIMQGQYDKAETLCERALEISERAVGFDHPTLTDHYANLAKIYAKKKEQEKAEDTYERILTILEKAYGEDHPKLVPHLIHLAMMFADRMLYDKAIPHYQRVTTIIEKAYGPYDRRLAVQMDNLAKAYRKLKDYDKAEPLFQRAIEIGEKALGPNHPDVAIFLKNYVRLLWRTDKAAEAKRIEARIRTIMKNRSGDDIEAVEDLSEDSVHNKRVI